MKALYASLGLALCVLGAQPAHGAEEARLEATSQTFPSLFVLQHNDSWRASSSCVQANVWGGVALEDVCLEGGRLAVSGGDSSADLAGIDHLAGTLLLADLFPGSGDGRDELVVVSPDDAVTLFAFDEAAKSLVTVIALDPPPAPGAVPARPS